MQPFCLMFKNWLIFKRDPQKATRFVVFLFSCFQHVGFSIYITDNPQTAFQSWRAFQIEPLFPIKYTTFEPEPSGWTCRELEWHLGFEPVFFLRGQGSFLTGLIEKLSQGGGGLRRGFRRCFRRCCVEQFDLLDLRCCSHTESLCSARTTKRQVPDCTKRPHSAKHIWAKSSCQRIGQDIVRRLEITQRGKI